MASLCGGFEEKSILKRKRLYEEPEDLDVDFDDGRHFKRTNLTRLPFRTSPTLSQDHAWQNLAPPFQRPLTPVDSSDEEAQGQADNIWRRRRADTSPARLPTNYKIPSVTIEIDAMDDDMEMEFPQHPIPRHSLPVPHRQSHLLSAPAISLDERVPTPISSSFNLSSQSPKSRRCRAVHYTVLSPVFAEEPSYLPSPIEPDGMYMDSDPEATMRIEHASSGFGALSVACRDDEMMMVEEEDIANAENTMRHSHARGGGGAKGNGVARNARLHMGFRADCEKCQQRVPGHYSHIIWS